MKNLQKNYAPKLTRPKSLYISVNICAVEIAIWNGSYGDLHWFVHFRCWIYFMNLFTTKNEKSMTELEKQLVLYALS